MPSAAASIDPYQAQPQIEQVSQQLRQRLIYQAKQFQRQSIKMKNEKFFIRQYYYLISTKWLKRWKKYVSYDQIVTKRQPNKFHGCGNLPKINEDIIDSSYVCPFKLQNKMSVYSTKLRPNLIQKNHFEFITQQMWSVLSYYSQFEVIRPVIQTLDGNKIEVYFINQLFVPLCNALLKSVQCERITKLFDLNLQYSRHKTVQQFLDDYEDDIVKFVQNQSYSCQISKSKNKRLWILPEGTRKTILYNTLQQGCKANPSFSYKLYLQGSIIQPSTKFQQIDLLPDSLLVVQLRQVNQKFNFFNLKHTLEAPCSNCKSITLLTHVCSCRYAVYCSKECKASDKMSHKFRCPNDAESDKQQKQLSMTPNSKRGLTGLRNLGNTCFMNSGLQCLSHIEYLTQYFLSGKYKNDINKNNPLGTQGQLSQQYAKMIRYLWFGEQSTFSPNHLKKSIAKFQPMFSGYNQHDSGQLITYLLDGLHEDLNRILNKPYTEKKDYDGRPDHIIAAQSWQTYLKRNSSVVVDLMYGQFKSVVECPRQKCKYISVTFDPFSVCSLPLVDKSMKQVEVVYIYNKIYSKKISFSYTMQKQYTITDKLDQIKNIIGVDKQARLIFYVASYSSCEIISQKSTIQQVRSQYKYRTVYVRELQTYENPQTDIKIMLSHVKVNKYYKDQSSRSNLTPFQIIFINPNMTNKQVFLLFCQHYSVIFQILKLPKNNIEKNYVSVQKQQEIFRILLIPSSRYYTCSYCDQKNCNGCKLPFNNKLFKQHINYNPESTWSKDKKIQIQFYWRKHQKQLQKFFQENGQKYQYGGGMKSSSSSYKKAEAISIKECLKSFEKQQILGSDNMWYCPKCKDFVEAKKQMKIYKAPKILALCLKRFKRKQYFSQKISTLVQFPIQNFDLTQYVVNKNLPNDNSNNGQNSQKKLVYDLIGISNHFGSTGGGHYTAFCKDPISGEWYDFDDSSVSKLNRKQDVITQSAYILFYQRRQ